MQIQGLQKLTLLDFPGKMACTVFTAGCNFRCPFCHNASLVQQGRAPEPIAEEAFFSLLAKRRGILEGVCVTGGEPLLQTGLDSFLYRIKELGFLVKLDTNGSFPDRLKALVQRELVDYVAMDIKNSREKYARTAGLDGDCAGELVKRIEESAAFLMNGSVDYEFRTTVVKEFHERSDFEQIGTWLRGAGKYFLQGFVDSGDLIAEGMLHACTPEEMRVFRQILSDKIGRVELRGIEN